MDRLWVIDLRDGEAKSAGICVGDYLDEYNGIKLVSSESLSTAMRKSSGTHAMKVIRDLKRIEIPVKAGPLGISVDSRSIIDIDDEAAVNQYIQQKKFNDSLQSVTLSTTPEIAGHVIEKTIEIVTAECVFGMGVFKDFFTGMSDFFGGRSKTTQDTLRSARQMCLSELKAEAVKVGANAVVGVSLDYSEFSGQGKSMLFLVASGTAVFVVEKAAVAEKI